MSDDKRREKTRTRTTDESHSTIVLGGFLISCGGKGTSRRCLFYLLAVISMGALCNKDRWTFAHQRLVGHFCSAAVYQAGGKYR